MKKQPTVRALVPKGVETILDIGDEGDLYGGDKWIVTTVDVVGNPTVVQDLNKNQRLPFPDNSFDLVVANQILEHLGDVEILISEIKRVSKKFIFIGLPHELNWKARIKLLIGRPDWSGFSSFGHKHFYTTKTIEDFIIRFFGTYSKREYWEPSNQWWFPEAANKFLKNAWPAMFCKEVFYLIEKEE